MANSEIIGAGQDTARTCAKTKGRNMVSQEQMKQFKELAKPLVKFLNDNFNPHTEIVIDSAHARILSGECGIPITEYLKD